jgi:HEAT repeat protein
LSSAPNANYSTLLAALQDPSPEVRVYAARGLGFLRGPKGVDSTSLSVSDRYSVISCLAGALRDESVNVRREAAGSLDRLYLDAGPAIEALVRALKDQDDSVRVSAATALGMYSMIKAVRLQPYLDDFSHALHDKDRIVRIQICWVVSRLSPQARIVVDDLAELLLDSDDLVRSTAASAIADLGAGSPKAVLNCCTMLRSDVGEYGWEQAARALGSMGRVAEPALPTLACFLCGGNPERRRISACAIGRIGIKSAYVMGVLSTATHDSDDRVKHEAEKAIKLLEAQ